MKTTLLTIRIVATIFYAWLFFYHSFSGVTCLIATAFIWAITSPETKKSEATTSDS